MRQKIFDLNTLDGSNGFKALGEMPGDGLGTSVSTAGDINADGINDLVLGAYFANSYSGASYVIFGSDRFESLFNLSKLNGTNGFTIQGIVPNGRLGYSVSTAGDINADGISDIVLGAAAADISYVIFGSRGGFFSTFNLTNLNGTNGFTVSSVATNSYLGWSVGTAGDINGDGISDLLLGAPNVNGISYVIFGKRGEFEPSFNLTNLNGSNGFMIPGVAAGGELGNSVGTAGDVNGDGIADLVLGAYFANSATANGASYVIFGSHSDFPAVFNLNNLNGINGFTISGIAANSNLGSSVSTAGDINGDGISDIVLGAPGAGGPNVNGASYVIFGSSEGFESFFNLTTLNGSNGFTIPGIAIYGELGGSVSTAGDINDDGIGDFVLGAPYANSGGASYIIFGNQKGFISPFNLNDLNGMNGFIVPGIALGDLLGSSVSSANDINNDGISDVVLGASGGGSTHGNEIYVIFGEFPLLWINHQMTITEGQTLLLANTQFNAIDINNPAATLVFTISNLQGGQFEFVSSPGNLITTFTQQQINTTQVRFVSNRTVPVAYQVSVSNGRLSIPPIQANVTFINHAPIIVNVPKTQVVIVNQPFDFTLVANQTFIDPDGDPLIYFAKLSDGSVLPSWLHFNTNQPNQLDFNGIAPAAGDTFVSLFAEDPLNVNISTEFEILAQSSNGNGTTIATSSGEIPGSIVGGLLGLGTLLGSAFAFWRYATDKNSRKDQHFADYIRNALNLKGVNNFKDDETGKQYITFVHTLTQSLQQAGIDITAMRPGEMHELANDVAAAARNKITPATDCLGRSEITIDDLKHKTLEIITEVQVLRNNGTQVSTYTI